MKQDRLLDYREFIGEQEFNSCPRYDNFYCYFVTESDWPSRDYVRHLRNNKPDLEKRLTLGITGLVHKRDSEKNIDFPAEMKKFEPDLYEAYKFLISTGYSNEDLGVVAGENS